MTVQHFHRRVGTKLPIKYLVVNSVEASIEKESALKGKPQQSRRPIYPVMLNQKSLVSEWGEVGKVMWIMLASGFALVWDVRLEVCTQREKKHDDRG